MKNFKKNINNLFICEECGKTFKDKNNGLSHHIYKYHNAKLYFDTWIKENNDDKCKICGNNVEFANLSFGYKNCCCKTCSSKYKYSLSIKSTYQKYGVNNVYQSELIKQKIHKTMKERYGAKHPSNSSILQNKRKETFLYKFNVESYVVTNEFKEKSKKTCIEKYGTEYSVQNNTVFNKMQKSSFLTKKFRDTELYYQGSYELDFLNKYYDKFPTILRGPSIKYEYNGKFRVYHSDFYLPSLNLIIECKNNYLLTRDKEIIEAKEKASINNGYNYCMILDKNYTAFEACSSSYPCSL